ncbi:unnamed protein product [Polarella glacialis]|jgi:hypothetical protein|uniref:Uncharacterized protein n=1 Tax=Polarella glacialis TaxID=89957 RepID=A0A813FMI6_POLGL|nr:unnamed protein product [Polarella glacialis]
MTALVVVAEAVVAVVAVVEVVEVVVVGAAADSKQAQSRLEADCRLLPPSLQAKDCKLRGCGRPCRKKLSRALVVQKPFQARQDKRDKINTHAHTTAYSQQTHNQATA